MYLNMMLEMNVIHAAWRNGCRELQFLGSSCIYPRLAPQPMPESCLLTSSLEKTNEAYALAKISGLKYCEYLNRQYGTDFISVMPTNLYGANDNYHPRTPHVLPALIRRFHEAKENGAEKCDLLGRRLPLREFLYVDDLANLCVFLMNNYSGNETVNAGTGKNCLSGSLHRPWRKSLVTGAESNGTLPVPTALPANFSMCRKPRDSAGDTALNSAKGSRWHMKIFLNNPMRAGR